MSLESPKTELPVALVQEDIASGCGKLAPLKIAIIHPTNWPHVRRGTERFMNELALYLSRRGHKVKIICSHPGPRKIVHEDGITKDYHRSLWNPFMARLGILDFHVFPITTFTSLLRERFDLAHCFNFTDALVAAWTRRITGVRVVLHLTSIPPAVHYRRSLTVGGAILRRAIHAADELVTVGKVQQKYFEARSGRAGTNMPGAVDMEAFLPSDFRDRDRPIIVCASALEEPRKGGKLLMRAFSRLKEIRPEVQLEVSGNVSDRLRSELFELVAPPWRSDVHFLGAGEPGDLPRLFGRAAVVVVPSLWETIPLVILESLATGTPVVATGENGFHEVIRPGVGQTFEPGPPNAAEPSNVDGLVRALLDTLELNQIPETPARCRAAAERYSWKFVGPQFEDIYRWALGGTLRPRRDFEEAKKS